MSRWHRRSVLATGAALTAIGGLASVGVGESNSNEDHLEGLPDPELDPNPEMDEDWASYRSGPGHARFVEDGREIDGDSLEVAWTVDHDGTIAVADDTVYTTTENGAIAYDATDGDFIWENTSVNASDPSVVGDTVYLTGEEVIALDRSDGDVLWETDLDPENRINGQTAAYGGIFVVADGTFYALEPDGGSIRWERESVTAEIPRESDETGEYDFLSSTAGANGVVYAATPAAALALEPETGDEVWRIEQEIGDAAESTQTQATASAVVAGRLSYAERSIHDAQAGGNTSSRVITSEGVEVALGEEMYVTGSDNSFDGRSYYWEVGDEGTGLEHSWEISSEYNAGAAVISEDTVYVYFEQAPSEDLRDEPLAEYSQALVALDKYDGSEKWTLSSEDVPVGSIRAISGETLYVDDDGELVALRERADEGEKGEDEDEGDEQPDEGDDDDEQGGGEPDDEDRDEGDDDEDAEEDDEETDGTESDCPDETPEPTCGDEDDGNDGSDESDIGDDGSGDDNEGETNESTGNGNETGNETDDESADDDGNTSDGNETADDEDDTDNVPGFTAGAGLVSGALGLEWLRRRADTDEPAD